VALLALALAGCASSGGKSKVATAGGTPSASSSASQQTGGMSVEEKMRKFTECMQENGVDMVIAGQGGVQAGDKGAPPPKLGGKDGSAKSADDDPKFKKAIEACRQYEPSGGDVPKPNPEQLAKLRAFTKCMREHGVDLPDPQADAGGGGAIPLGGDGADAIDPNSAKFKKANEACRGPGPGGSDAVVGRAG
jgi:hypothetical protein